MKPAEQSSVVAYRLMEILQNVGIPDGVVNYLPGVGEEVGPELIASPDVHLVAFTGSRSVGLAINQAASQAENQQNFVKRVIAEMGGKNAIIIDDDADLDEAVLGDRVQRLRLRGTKVLGLLPRHRPGVGLRRVRRQARAGDAGPESGTGRTAGDHGRPGHRRGGVPAHSGIHPARERDCSRRWWPATSRSWPAKGSTSHRTSSATSIRRRSWPARRSSARSWRSSRSRTWMRPSTSPTTRSTRSPAASSAAVLPTSAVPVNEMQVGNLYLNRGITGALVERQPFGGYKLSGIGTKAGGPDYLLQFVIPDQRDREHLPPRLRPSPHNGEMRPPRRARGSGSGRVFWGILGRKKRGAKTPKNSGSTPAAPFGSNPDRARANPGSPHRPQHTPLAAISVLQLVD